MSEIKEEKTKVEARRVRYLRILEFIEKEPTSRKEITVYLKSLGLDIFENSLIKDYLDQMVEKREIGNLEIGNNNYKFVLKVAYNKIWKEINDYYYFRTLKSEELYNTLTNLIKYLIDKKEAQRLINEICDTFRVIELFAKLNPEALLY